MKYVLVFITVGTSKEGRKIGKNLISKKLAACVNQIPGVTSTYWWKGKIEQARENLLIVKTSGLKLKGLIAEVKKIHSYTVPEIIALPIAKGNRDYLKWIGQSLKSTSRNSSSPSP